MATARTNKTSAKRNSHSTLDDAEVNWVECSECKGWDIYENFRTGQQYNPAKISKLHLVCRHCTMEQALQKCNNDIAILMEKCHALELAHSKDANNGADDVRDSSNITSTGLPHQVLTMHHTQLTSTADEVFEIAKRKLNVVISGLPESGKDIEDFLHFANTYHNLAITLSSSDIDYAERLGRVTNSSRPRLLCLRLNSVTARRTILDMWKNPKPCGTRPNVYTRPDLTKAQLETDKLLRHQLLIAGKDKYKIHRGAIVERISNSHTTSNSQPTSLDLPITCTVNIPPKVDRSSAVPLSAPSLAVSTPTALPLGNISANVLKVVSTDLISTPCTTSTTNQHHSNSTVKVILSADSLLSTPAVDTSAPINLPASNKSAKTIPIASTHPVITPTMKSTLNRLQNNSSNSNTVAKPKLVAQAPTTRKSLRHEQNADKTTTNATKKKQDA